MTIDFAGAVDRDLVRAPKRIIPVTQTTPDSRWPISYNPDDGKFYVESEQGTPGMAIVFQYTHSHRPRRPRAAVFAARWGAQQLVRALASGTAKQV